MELNQAVLGEVLAWGQALPGFKPAFARNALTVIQGYTVGVPDRRGGFIHGIAPDRPRELALFTIDMAWLFWLDEQFDGRSPASALDPEALIHGILEDGSSEGASPFHPLRDAFSSCRDRAADYRLWATTLADVVRSWQAEAMLCQGRVRMSYSEYMENGVYSTTILHVLATASLLYDLGIARRATSEPLQRLMRHLSLYCRVENDLNSLDKERREGSVANAVILMERFAPTEVCVAFLQDELEGQARLVATAAREVGDDDRLCQLARIMPEVHRVMYENPRGTYRFTEAREEAPRG